MDRRRGASRAGAARHRSASLTSPEIIAHRGASRERPENTLSAFSRAVDLGADAVELDVHLSADGVLMVHHDPVPHQAPRPSLAGQPIGALTVNDLSAFRVGGEPIPTLSAVLERTAGAVTVYCELKGPRTAAGAVALLDRPGVRAAVHAFDHRQVADARRLAPAVPRGVLEASYHVDPTFPLASVDARDLWQLAEMIDQPLVDTVHARTGRVIAWTVDDATEIERLTSLGVDGLCTNDVTLTRRVLGR